MRGEGGEPSYTAVPPFEEKEQWEAVRHSHFQRYASPPPTHEAPTVERWSLPAQKVEEALSDSMRSVETGASTHSTAEDFRSPSSLTLLLEPSPRQEVSAATTEKTEEAVRSSSLTLPHPEPAPREPHSASPLSTITTTSSSMRKASKKSEPVKNEKREEVPSASPLSLPRSRETETPPHAVPTTEVEPKQQVTEQAGRYSMTSGITLGEVEAPARLTHGMGEAVEKRRRSTSSPYAFRFSHPCSTTPFNARQLHHEWKRKRDALRCASPPFMLYPPFPSPSPRSQERHLLKEEEHAKEERRSSTPRRGRASTPITSPLQKGPWSFTPLRTPLSSALPPWRSPVKRLPHEERKGTRTSDHDEDAKQSEKLHGTTLATASHLLLCSSPSRRKKEGEERSSCRGTRTKKTSEVVTSPSSLSSLPTWHSLSNTVRSTTSGEWGSSPSQPAFPFSGGTQKATTPSTAMSTGQGLSAGWRRGHLEEGGAGWVEREPSAMSVFSYGTNFSISPAPIREEALFLTPLSHARQDSMTEVTSPLRDASLPPPSSFSRSSSFTSGQEGRAPAAGMGVARDNTVDPQEKMDTKDLAGVSQGTRQSTHTRLRSRQRYTQPPRETKTSLFLDHHAKTCDHLSREAREKSAEAKGHATVNRVQRGDQEEKEVPHEDLITSGETTPSVRHHTEDRSSLPPPPPSLGRGTALFPLPHETSTTAVDPLPPPQHSHALSPPSQGGREEVEHGSYRKGEVGTVPGSTSSSRLRGPSLQEEALCGEGEEETQDLVRGRGETVSTPPLSRTRYLGTSSPPGGAIPVTSQVAFGRNPTEEKKETEKDIRHGTPPTAAAQRSNSVEEKRENRRWRSSLVEGPPSLSTAVPMTAVWTSTMPQNAPSASVNSAEEGDAHQAVSVRGSLPPPPLPSPHENQDRVSPPVSYATPCPTPQDETSHARETPQGGASQPVQRPATTTLTPPNAARRGSPAVFRLPRGTHGGRNMWRGEAVTSPMHPFAIPPTQGTASLQQALLSSLHHADHITAWERIRAEVMWMGAKKKNWCWIGAGERASSEEGEESEEVAIPLCYAASRTPPPPSWGSCEQVFWGSETYKQGGGVEEEAHRGGRASFLRTRATTSISFPRALGNVDRAVDRLSRTITRLFRSSSAAFWVFPSWPVSSSFSKAWKGAKQRTEVEVAAACVVYRLQYVDETFLPTLPHVFGAERKPDAGGRPSREGRQGGNVYGARASTKSGRSAFSSEEEDEEEEEESRRRLRMLEWNRAYNVANRSTPMSTEDEARKREEEAEEEALLWKLRDRRLRMLEYRSRIREQHRCQDRVASCRSQLQEVLFWKGAIFFLRATHVLPFLTGMASARSLPSTAASLAPPLLPLCCFPDGEESIRPYGFHVGRYLRNGELVAGLGALAEACGAIRSIFSSNPLAVSISIAARTADRRSPSHSFPSSSPKRRASHQREKSTPRGSHHRNQHHTTEDQTPDTRRSASSRRHRGTPPQTVAVAHPPIILVWANPFGLWELVTVDSFFPCVMITKERSSPNPGTRMGVSPPPATTTTRQVHRGLLGCFAWGRRPSEAGQGPPDSLATTSRLRMGHQTLSSPHCPSGEGQRKEGRIALWPAACEKALAKVFGGYAQTCALSATRCVSCFTGGPVEQWSWWRHDPTAALIEMESALHYQNVRGNTILLLRTIEEEEAEDERKGKWDGAQQPSWSSTGRKGGTKKREGHEAGPHTPLASVRDLLKGAGLRFGTTYRVLAVSNTTSSATASSSSSASFTSSPLLPLFPTSRFSSAFLSMPRDPTSLGEGAATRTAAEEVSSPSRRTHIGEGRAARLPPPGPRLLLRVWHEEEAEEEEEEEASRAPPSRDVSPRGETTFLQGSRTSAALSSSLPPSTSSPARPSPTASPSTTTTKRKAPPSANSVWVEYEHLVLRCFDTCHACFDCRRFHDVRIPVSFQPSGKGATAMMDEEVSLESETSSHSRSRETSSGSGTCSSGSASTSLPSLPPPSAYKASFHSRRKRPLPPVGEVHSHAHDRHHRHRKEEEEEAATMKKKRKGATKRPTAEEEWKSHQHREGQRHLPHNEAHGEAAWRDPTSFLFSSPPLASSFFLSSFAVPRLPLIPTCILRIRVLGEEEERRRIRHRFGSSSTTGPWPPPTTCCTASQGASVARMWIGFHQPYRTSTAGAGPISFSTHQDPTPPSVFHAHGGEDGVGEVGKAPVYGGEEAFGLRLSLIYRRGEEELRMAMRHRHEKWDEETDEEREEEEEILYVQEENRWHRRTPRRVPPSPRRSTGASSRHGWTSTSAFPTRHPFRYAMLSESYGGQYRALPSVWMHLELHRPMPPPPPLPRSTSSSASFCPSTLFHGMGDDRSSRTYPMPEGYTEFYVVPQLTKMTIEEEKRAALKSASFCLSGTAVSSRTTTGSHSSVSGPPSCSVGGEVFTSSNAALSLLTPTPTAFQVDLLSAPPELAAAIQLHQLDGVEYDHGKVLSGSGSTEEMRNRDGPAWASSREGDASREEPSTLSEGSSHATRRKKHEKQAQGEEDWEIYSQVNGHWKKGFEW